MNAELATRFSPQLLPPATRQAALHYAPPLADVPHRFASTPGGRAMERAVLRPIDLTATHGIVVKAENLRRMVESYDPAFEAAMLNFDHEWGGPSHGHCTRLWLEGEFLWSRFERLTPEALSGVESGQWTRCSSEFYASHPQTKDWYFVGLALLGSKSPAVPGLGDARLLSRPVYRLASGVIEKISAAPTEPPVVSIPTSYDARALAREVEITVAGEPALAAENLYAAAAAPVEMPGGAPAATGEASTPEADSALLAQQQREVEDLKAAIARDTALLHRERAALEAETGRPSQSRWMLTATERVAGLTTDDVDRIRRKYPDALARHGEAALLDNQRGFTPRPAAVLSAAEIIAGVTHDQADLIELKYADSFARLGSDRVALETARESSAQPDTSLSIDERIAGLTPSEARRIELKYPDSFERAERP